MLQVEEGRVVDDRRVKAVDRNGIVKEFEQCKTKETMVRTSWEPQRSLSPSSKSYVQGRAGREAASPDATPQLPFCYNGVPTLSIRSMGCTTTGVMSPFCPCYPPTVAF